MATWEQNKDYIIRKVNEGAATPSMQQWYDEWTSLGQPSSKEAMTAARLRAQEAAQAPTPQQGPLASSAQQYQDRLAELRADRAARLDAIQAQQDALTFGGESAVVPQQPVAAGPAGRVGQLLNSIQNPQTIKPQAPAPQPTVTPPTSTGEPPGTVVDAGGGLTFEDFYGPNGEYMGNNDFTFGGESGASTNTGGGQTQAPDQSQMDPINWAPGSPIVTQAPSQEFVDQQINWDAFTPGASPRPGGAGVNPANYAPDYFTPGKESPWGVPAIEGGNKDFYRNQLLNQLSMQQSYQDRQRQASAIRQQALQEEANRQPFVASDFWESVGYTGPEIMKSGYASPMPNVGFGEADFGYTPVDQAAMYYRDPNTGIVYGNDGSPIFTPGGSVGTTQSKN